MQINKIKKRKGFSLVEMLISLFIFSVVMLSVMAVFASVVKVRKSSEKYQRNLENIRSAMERIAKTVRMSTSQSPAGMTPVINVYSNSRQECVSYKFETNQIKEARCTSIDDTAIDRCSMASPCAGGAAYSYTPITDAVISSGNFFLVNTTAAINGYVYMSFQTGSDVVQTTISFRDYIH